MDAQEAILADDSKKMLKCLTTMSQHIEAMALLLKRMYEKCDADVWWNKVRIYSGGSRNSTSFPDGVFYEGVDEVP